MKKHQGTEAQEETRRIIGGYYPEREIFEPLSGVLSRIFTQALTKHWKEIETLLIEITQRHARIEMRKAVLDATREGIGNISEAVYSSSHALVNEIILKHMARAGEEIGVLKKRRRAAKHKATSGGRG